jgi:hypothetical protein
VAFQSNSFFSNKSVNPTNWESKAFSSKNCAKNYVGKEENEFMEELSKLVFKNTEEKSSSK